MDNTVYTVIRDVVMSSGDISVFWQEIIDSYRDIMVVKNSDKAKSYLDLTDVEYDTLKRISSSFSMAKLSYHTSLLENAMADMQRAVNSKRSIAEIALTRMCEPKLVVTAEALAVRVDELEKQLSMMKMGIPTAAVHVPATTTNVAESCESDTVESDDTMKNEDSQLSRYDRWHSVVERIGELKRSLSSQFVGSEAYKRGDAEFLIRMSSFFAARISASAADFAILRGVIAEIEGKDVGLIKVTVEGVSNADAGNKNELDNLFN